MNVATTQWRGDTQANVEMHPYPKEEEDVDGGGGRGGVGGSKQWPDNKRGGLGRALTPRGG